MGSGGSKNARKSTPASSNNAGTSNQQSNGTTPTSNSQQVQSSTNGNVSATRNNETPMTTASSSSNNVSSVPNNVPLPVNNNTSPSSNGQASSSNNQTYSKAKFEMKSLLDKCDDLEKMILEAMTNLSKEKTRVNMKRISGKGLVDHSLLGSVGTKVPSTAKIVRIFTSSTFTDTMHERNFWMNEAYPKVKAFCQSQGYEFQVVDMRWGVRDEAMDDHSSTDLCLKELQQCQAVSTGPNFVSLLSHKYGYRSLPKFIDAEEFDKICPVVESNKSKALLKKWYVRDDNAVPPHYVLSRISKHLPEFVGTDKDARNKAKSTWWEESDTMQETLESAAQIALGEEEAKKYIISVTEKEVQMGMLNVDDPEKHCLWFRRIITDIENQEPNYQLSRYIECLGPEVKWKKSRELLKTLEDDKMLNHMDEENVVTYTVSWTDKGLDPENPEHKKYLLRISDDLVNKLCHMIEEAIKEREKSSADSFLQAECMQHIRFCQEKCENFYGRDETLTKIKNYLLSDETKPLVIHGPSGCGKTSLVAMTAKMVSSWMTNTDPLIVIRFIGTTPDSSNINSLLISVIQQINMLYGYEVEVPEWYNVNVDNGEEFAIRIVKQILSEPTEGLSSRLPKPSQPLVLLLDSLDQLDPSNNARALSWLPLIFGKNVKLIVSTLEEEVYESFPRLQVILKKPDNYVSVPKLENADVKGIVDHWLTLRKRALTPKQREILIKSFDNCPLPLFLKLSFEEACRWHSYWRAEQTTLQKTIRSSINTLFSRLEKHHGMIFVSRALGYLTTAKSGLSESELEDVISCDDDVLNDVYQYWTPPMRRLPPLLLVRLRSDLQQYLVDRGADGVRVMYWYHRQFIEAAAARYCTKDITKQLHVALAEFFAGIWSDGYKKPYKTKEGTPGEADRRVTGQPLKYGDTYNIRKLNNLPYHRIMAGQKLEFKGECLLNFNFLFAKLHSASVRTVLDDMTLAMKIFPEDDDITLMCNAIQLSQEALAYDAVQLVPQMIDRLAGEKSLTSFCEDCKTCPLPYIMPDQEILMKPGGQLVNCLPDHKGPLSCVDMKKNGKIIVTCSEDEEDSVKVFDIEDARLVKSYDKLGESPSRLFFVADDSLILVEYTDYLKAIRETGEIAYSVKYSPGDWTVAGKGRNQFFIFKNWNCKILDAHKGDLLKEMKIATKKRFQEMIPSTVAGSDNFVVVSDHEQHYFTVLNLKTQKFSDWVEVFKPPATDDDDDLTIEAVAISPDETKIIAANFYDNNLHIYNMKTLQKVKTIPGDEKDFSSNFRITPDNRRLYFPNNLNVVSFDLTKGQRSAVLPHPGEVKDVICSSWHKIITVCEDTIIRVWDLDKIEKLPISRAPVLGFKICKFESLPNCRYVVMTVQAEKKNSQSGSINVYDLHQQKVVRQCSMQILPKLIKVVDDFHVIVATDNRKMKILNLDTLSIEKVFEGKLTKYPLMSAVEIIKNGKELVTFSRGMTNFKTYDLKTCKTKSILVSPIGTTNAKQKYYNEFYTNRTSLLIGKVDEDGPVVLFDLMKSSCLYIITDKSITDDMNWTTACISPDGQFFTCYTNIDMKIPGKKKTESIIIGAVWDVKKKSTLKQLEDKDHQIKYSTKENRRGLDTSICDIYAIDNDHVLTTHDDFILRMWNIKTGQIEKYLEGHRTNVDVKVLENSPYIVTCASAEEENAFRVWDKRSLECVASYKLDHSIVNFEMCSDGLGWISNTKMPEARMVYWQVNGLQTKTSHPPVLFKGEVVHVTVEINDDENDDQDDPDDIDNDEDVPSDDDFGDEDDEDDDNDT